MVTYSALWQFFRVVAHNAVRSFALLPTTWKNAPHRRLQRQSFFRVVGDSAKNCFYFSSYMFFALLPTTPIIFMRCGTQCGKIISVVAYTAEKSSSLLATMRKMVEFE
jgi:hypothetical protein